MSRSRVIRAKRASVPRRIHFDPSGQRDRVLYLGSPSDLPTEVLSVVGVLTTDEVEGTDLAVRCFGDGTVEIVPTQLRLRACRLTARSTRRNHRGRCQPHRLRRARVFPNTRWCSVESSNATPKPMLAHSSPLQPSQGEPELEVRVLTNAPTITGASNGRISPEGRHFELVALIALSGGLSKEEARAAIYGSGSSTENVANIASQARKMLGTDSDGHPFCQRQARREFSPSLLGSPLT